MDEENRHNLDMGFSVVPAKITCEAKINSTGQLVYGIISKLSNRDGSCWPTNKYLAD